MRKEELDNLVKIGQLKAEPGTLAEFDGLVDSARKRLADARNESLSSESRFDLAYNAAHALALAALRRCGYRSENRYVVFQSLAHTLGMDAAIWRVLAKCHNQRNLVNVGQTVTRGQAVALMGSSGRSTGPHVHFEVLKDGRQVDPLTFIGR